jgi:hypothetical protein
MKIRPVGDESLGADRRKDRHQEANSRFPQILWTRLKTVHFFKEGLSIPFRYRYTFQKAFGIATYYGLDGPAIQFRWGRDFPCHCRPASRPKRPPIQWIPVLFAWDKAAGEWRWRPTSRAEVENGLNNRPTSPLWFHWHVTEWPLPLFQ